MNSDAQDETPPARGAPEQMLVFESAGQKACVAVDHVKFARTLTHFLHAGPAAGSLGAGR